MPGRILRTAGNCPRSAGLRRDSEAFRGGVQRGDFIVEVNNARIRTLQDLKKELIHHDLREPMCVFLLSCGGWRFTSLSFVKGF